METTMILISVAFLFSAIRICQIYSLEGGLSGDLWKALSQIFLYEKLEDK